MSDASTNLGLPFLQSAQAQKHVTVNQGLLRLDAVVQMAPISAAAAAQPSAPNDGDLYILPPGKTGADWGAMADYALAYYRDGVWEQLTPREGWTAYVRDTDQMLVYNGSSWAALDALSAHLAGTETITGAKTFSANVVIDKAPAKAQPAAIGTNQFRIIGDDGEQVILLFDAIGGPGTPAFVMRAARGTRAAPQALQTNNNLFNFQARGYGATGYSDNARVGMNFCAGENWTDTAQGAYISWTTAANGGTTATEKMRLTPSGYLTFGGVSSSVPMIKPNGAALNFRKADDSGDADITAGKLMLGGPAVLKSYTVATLPSASSAGAGAMAYVTDASAPSYNATVAGGGSVGVGVRSDGTNWKCC